MWARVPLLQPGTRPAPAAACATAEVWVY